MMEDAMIGVPSEKSEFSQDESGTKSVSEFNPCSELVLPIVPPEEASRRVEPPLTDADAFKMSMDRFADLSKEMVAIVSKLSRRVNELEAQLQTISSEIDLKKKELLELHHIDAAAVSLSLLAEEQRAQKAHLERLIFDQQSHWENEKKRIEQEECEFQESLKLQRRREEEAYRRASDFEQQEIHRKLELELQEIRQKASARQEEKNRELVKREQALIEKERESSLLVHELDGFLSQLELRLNSAETVSMDTRRRVDLLKGGSSKPTLSSLDEVDPSILMPVNEMALSLKRDEDPHKDIPIKQESTLLQFSFKKPVST
jgi:hypothetical protein